MRRAVIVILDGLRRDFVDAARTPHLAALAGRAETFPLYRSVFPSATRVVSATMATGCYPARHELQGNSLALLADGRLAVFDAGLPDFLDRKRELTGRRLAVPTMAERVAGAGGAIVYNNVSPGAAYAHDPDGHGHVYHRAGAYGPGRTPLPADTPPVSVGIEGDRVVAQRFLADALGARRPALALLWLSEPDAVQHARPLGSPEHLAALRTADALAGEAMAAVERLRAEGDDILLIVGSDHGHETVTGTVDVEAELVEAGLKDAPGSSEIVAVPNGTASLVYIHPDAADRTETVGAFLRAQPWAGRVLDAAALPQVGQIARHGLAFAVALASDAAPNAFGIPGSVLEAVPGRGKAGHLGHGSHGGLGRFEQSPFIAIDGPGFARGAARQSAMSAVDIAPTVLAHLGLPVEGMDGRPLQDGIPPAMETHR
jgi:hypothetical protein